MIYIEAGQLQEGTLKSQVYRLKMYCQKYYELMILQISWISAKWFHNYHEYLPCDTTNIMNICQYEITGGGTGQWHLHGGGSGGSSAGEISLGDWDDTTNIRNVFMIAMILSQISL